MKILSAKGKNWFGKKIPETSMPPNEGGLVLLTHLKPGLLKETARGSASSHAASRESHSHLLGLQQVENLTSVGRAEARVSENQMQSSLPGVFSGSTANCGLCP